MPPVPDSRNATNGEGEARVSAETEEKSATSVSEKRVESVFARGRLFFCGLLAKKCAKCI